MGDEMRILVTGAGGFIGSHLTTKLVNDGHEVVGVDLKFPEFEGTTATEFYANTDLRCESVVEKFFDSKPYDRIYHLAADMGGIGFIESHKCQIIVNNSRINLNVIEKAFKYNAKRLLFSSSACIYPTSMQSQVDVTPLREDDAYPALPEDGYGWEKLTMERICRHYREDLGFDTRVVRFHNIYGPLGTYDGGREKSPAAVCRKIALANSNDEIEVWGDGKQTRSYCFIDDCVDGLIRLMESNHCDPINLGTDRLVSVNELYDIVACIAGKNIRKQYDESKPQGVRGRNSDNSMLRKILKWEPHVSFEDGMDRTYKWIKSQVRSA
jgi:GDP-D-mannose 3',5'-epimerase